MRAGLCLKGERFEIVACLIRHRHIGNGFNRFVGMPADELGAPFGKTEAVVYAGHTADFLLRLQILAENSVDLIFSLGERGSPFFIPKQPIKIPKRPNLEEKLKKCFKNLFTSKNISNFPIFDTL